VFNSVAKQDSENNLWCLLPERFRVFAVGNFSGFKIMLCRGIRMVLN